MKSVAVITNMVRSVNHSIQHNSYPIIVVIIDVQIDELKTTKAGVGYKLIIMLMMTMKGVTN